jgi:hypothetical protein
MSHPKPGGACHSAAATRRNNTGGRLGGGGRDDCRKEGFARHLDAETSLAPVPTLGVVTDGVARSESDPLRHRAVLLLRLGKLLLGTERLVARHLGWLCVSRQSV